uniref:ATP synthase F0 subunit 8 n=1 Tax=Setodes brevicaudatus TaxID=1876047 RepID=UPI0022DCDE57|nr:ATP synthase F0 subunit 8 [Setodes brevicaudatus]UZZ44380.1 ATP synthase F0 subunit 8 [Setodes brevicaudatus]
MPQMMPFNWIMMFFIFLMTFSTLIIIFYYVYTPTLYFKKKMNSKLIFNWKW